LARRVRRAHTARLPRDRRAATLTGFGDDVAATNRAIDQQVARSSLVGHSYGGAVITVAGTDRK